MYAGKCLGGPYDGQEYASSGKQIYVTMLDGNPLKGIPIMREGHYDWEDGVFMWDGPAYPKKRPLISNT